MDESRPAPPSLDDQLCFALYSASRAVTRAYGPILAGLGLTYPQYVTMIAVWESDGPVAVGDLGRRLRLDTGTLTPMLKRLEQLGLVSRMRDATDERRVLVAPTAEGDALRRRACEVPDRIRQRYGTDVEALVALKAQLDHLVTALDGAA